MANKMMPDFDQAVSSCISEMLFNRTRDGSSLNKDFYSNINAVRYHRERNNPGFNIDDFKC
ncbi:hypothetical protein PRIPAC_85837 [Pristionchus pacificus]|uniref:Uncharacterized protein n=1 Tax=Pristionchus pacificus TaxID=54126 RepID=A0A2A6BT97_PRIPA|nr:hypothetical protein PRIPAC_85837 [Pristionchus pacificus]|eukprot:PDM69202.1 hypothetical protein PRIPAC_47504 [Pristionchus pacificus]